MNIHDTLKSKLDEVGYKYSVTKAGNILVGFTVPNSERSHRVLLMATSDDLLAYEEFDMRFPLFEFSGNSGEDGQKILNILEFGGCPARGAYI